MGCVPSHSDAACTLAKSGIRFFKKPHRALLPGPQAPEDGYALPRLVHNSTCYEPAGQSWAQTSAEEQPDARCVRTAAEAQLQRDTSECRRKGPEGSALGPRTPEASPSHMAKDETPRTSHPPGGAEQQEEGGSRGPLGGGPDTGRREAHEAWAPGPRSEGKVDFPEPLVRAHQRAYAFLHTSLGRYEAVLRATHRATSTQELLRPMLGLLLLCFQEANQLLGDISAEGDALLQEVRGDMTWLPLGKGDPPPERPDLLQQLLEHTVNRLRVLGSAVASVSGGLLGGSGDTLHAASRQLGAALSTQRALEEHILGVLDQLQGLAGGHGEPGGPGAPLCSEDSGISADCESVDRLGRQTSGDSAVESAGRDPGLVPISGTRWQSTPWTGIHGLAPQDCPLARPSTAKVQPAAQARAGNQNTRSSSETAEKTPFRAGGQSQSPPQVPQQREVSAEMHLPRSPRWMDSLSLSTGGDSSLDGEEDEAGGQGPCTWLDNAQQPRPRTSPGGSGSTFQLHSARLADPQAREMILKVKEAISKRIKFVPPPTGAQEWTEDERPAEELPRPRTVGDTRPWRSLSDTCLWGPGGESSLQELPGSQRALGLRLEAPQELGARQVPRTVALRPDRGPPSTPMRRLKASLTKNFSILPSPDRSILLRCVPRPQEKAERLPRGPPSSEEAGAEHEESQEPPARTSVRKLIETFSPTPSVRTVGDDKEAAPGRRTWGIPSVPSRFPIYRGLAPLYPKPRVAPVGRGLVQADLGWRTLEPLVPPLPTSEGGGTDTESEEDPELLPPPPPEVLMDTSFTSLEPRQGSEAGSSPQGTLVTELEALDAPPSLRASVSLSGTTVVPTRPQASGPRGNRGLRHPGRSPLDPRHPKAASKTPEVRGGQVQGGRAVGLSKQSRRAAPWHHAGHTPGPDKPSEPSAPSPEAPKKSQERSSPRGRQTSPTRTPKTPRVDKRPPGLPSAPGPSQSSVPSAQASPSPPLSPLQSPPSMNKRGSPLSLPRLPSPPGRHQDSSRPAQHSEASSPSSGPSQSPPLSPARLCKGTRNSSEGEAATAAGPQNTCSVFCPATASLFEARPFSRRSLPPEAGGACGSPPGCWSSSSSGSALRAGPPQGGPLRTLNPQPFIRRTTSDRRPRAHLSMPGSSTCSPVRESLRGQGSGSSEDVPKEAEAWSSPGSPELKGGGRGASPPELCVLGRGLQGETRAGHAQPPREARPLSLRHKAGGVTVMTASPEDTDTRPSGKPTSS